MLSVVSAIFRHRRKQDKQERLAAVMQASKLRRISLVPGAIASHRGIPAAKGIPPLKRQRPAGRSVAAAAEEHVAKGTEEKKEGAGLRGAHAGGYLDRNLPSLAARKQQGHGVAQSNAAQQKKQSAGVRDPYRCAASSTSTCRRAI